MTETTTTAEQPLTIATEDLMKTIEKNNRKARNLGGLAIVMLLIIITIGVIGIYQQNSIAKANKNHIDCIIKDLSTPLPSDKKSRVIDYKTRLTADCKIKFN